MVELDIDADAEEACTQQTDELWFVCCIANPSSYASRFSLYEKFKRHVMDDLKARLCVVECVYGSEQTWSLQDDAAAAAERFMHVPVRAASVMWHKENLLNIGIRALPSSATQVCWCDADIEFLDHTRATQAIRAELRRNDVVQCFSSCLDMGPEGAVLKIDHSFAFSRAHGLAKTAKSDFTCWHSGYVWAANRRFIERIGYLFDKGIVGSGDRFMAQAFTDDIESYRAQDRGDVVAFVEWCDAFASRDVACAYVPLVIRHGFHGFKKDRQYGTRGKILTDAAFNPVADLVTNADGVFEWSDSRKGSKLEADMVQYFVRRKEDAL